VDVPSDSYSVYVALDTVAQLDGCYDSSTPGHYADYGDCDDTGTQLVTVGSANRTGISIQMPTGYLIKGTVTSTGGTPLGGIWVEADSTTGGDWGGVETAANGTYAIGVPNDNYSIEFLDDAGVYLTGYYSITASGHFTTDQDFASGVTLAGADLTVPTVLLPIGFSISGTVTGTGNAPVAGIDVYTETDNCTSSCYSTNTTTDTDGTYTLHVPAGSYDVSFADNNDPKVYIDTDYGHVVDATTADAPNIDIQLQAGRHISGTVTSAGGPVADVFVETNTGDYTYTDADGTYDIFAAPGSYTLYFEDESSTYLLGYYRAGVSGHFTTDLSLATPVDVTTADAPNIDVTLVEGLTIQGRVTDPHGNPVQNIEVDATSSGYGGFGTTDPDGNYSVPVIAGDYTLTFRDYGGVFDTGYYDDAISGFFTLVESSATPVTVDATNVTGKDIQIYGRPSAPDTVSAIGYNASAVVTWSASADNGKAITAYTVVASAPGSPLVKPGVVKPGAVKPGAVRPGAVKRAAIKQGAIKPAATGSPSCTTLELTCTITGLVNGDDYFFTVWATNSEGDGYATDSDWTLVRVGDTYVPIEPTRIVNSQTGVGVPVHRLVPYTPVTFPVAGVGDIPANATAVTGVLTVISPTALGYLSLTPTPVPHPTTSNLNFPKGDSRSTGMTVTLNGNNTGTGDGTLSVTYSAGAGTSADFYFDVTGYFIVGTEGATYKTVTPNRLVDTRVNNGISGKIKAGTATQFIVVDRNPTNDLTNVPSNAVAVTGNLTITDQSAAGHLTLTPDAQSSPTTASIYTPKGDIRATGLTMMLSEDGTLWVTFVSTAGATTSVVFDVTGYFVDGPVGAGATYVPVTPNRLVDSRVKNGISSKLLPYASRSFQVTNRVPSDATKNIPSSAIAITGTLTVTGATALGWLALTTTQINHPGTSTINFPKYDTRANGVTVPLGAGGKEWVALGSGKGSYASVVFDVSGYFVN
jgi:hypothetical protein